MVLCCWWARRAWRRTSVIGKRYPRQRWSVNSLCSMKSRRPFCASRTSLARQRRTAPCAHQRQLVISSIYEYYYFAIRINIDDMTTAAGCTLYSYRWFVISVWHPAQLKNNLSLRLDYFQSLLQLLHLPALQPLVPQRVQEPLVGLPLHSLFFLILFFFFIFKNFKQKQLICV